MRNLFFNIPARRKFLRSEQTELAHVRQMFLVYALSHPEVGLHPDRGRAGSVPAGRRGGDGGPAAGIVRRGIYEVTAPGAVSRRRSPVRGYAGLPQASRADRTEQYIFINRRPAAAPLLSYALAEAYHTLLPRGRYPVLYLYIEMDPSHGGCECPSGEEGSALPEARPTCAMP